jgi:N4-gp56 family major capsid protein
MGNLVKAAYDKYVEFALRPEPLFRAVADKRPVDVTSAGSSVTFYKYSDLATQTTALAETTAFDPIPGVPNPSGVTVTLNAYGNVVLKTERLKLFSLSDVDPAIADIVAYNMRDSIDELVRTVLIGGSNVITSAAGAVETPAVAVATLTASDLFTSAHVRYCVTKLRASSVIPRKDGLFWASVHPDVSHDLRKETGAAAWRDPHNYTSNSQIWAGEIGEYEGAFFVESPRAYEATDGASSAKVARTLFAGKQALAEASAQEPQLVMGPMTDPLERYSPVGWKALLGWALYRTEALYQVNTGTSVA